MLVPLLTLGIPTSATAAILLAAFQNYGIQPGPLLFQTQASLVWALIASLYVGNVLLLVLNLSLIGLWVQVLKIPKPLLYGAILVFARLGAYSLHQSVVDLVTLYVFGLLGFGMRRWGFPVAPAVIGLILGPLAESQMRRALSISQGDPSVFVTQPISAALFLLTAVILLAPLVARAMRRRRGEDAQNVAERKRSQLPPQSDAERIARRRILENRTYLASLKCDLLKLQGEYTQLVREANSAIGQATMRIRRTFAQYAKQFLEEDVDLDIQP